MNPSHGSGMEYYSPLCYISGGLSALGGMLFPDERGERWGTSETDG